KGQYEGLRLRASNHPNTPVAVLEQLSHDAEEVVRAFVARRTALPGAELERLSADPSLMVRIGVVLNDLCPASLKAKLCETPEIREELAKIERGFDMKNPTNGLSLQKTRSSPNPM